MGRKLGLDRVLDCFSLSQLCANACVCVHSVEEEEDDDEDERRALVSRQLQELKDFVDGAAKTLAFHLEPKTVELKVSMHCYGCAKKVQKHIAKMDVCEYRRRNWHMGGVWGGEQRQRELRSVRSR